MEIFEIDFIGEQGLKIALKLGWGEGEGEGEVIKR